MCVCGAGWTQTPASIRHFRRAAALIKSSFKLGQVVSRLLMRCEQIWTGPRSGPRPVSTLWAAVGGVGLRCIVVVRLYNYVSFVRAWSVSTGFVCQELHLPAGMLLSVWVLMLLSRSHKRSHNVPAAFPQGYHVVHSFLGVVSHSCSVLSAAFSTQKHTVGFPFYWSIITTVYKYSITASVSIKIYSQYQKVTIR